MNPLALLLFMVGQLAAVGHAPPDVPKDHWAYQAVDELFQAGLLDGYPPDVRSFADDEESFAKKAIKRLATEHIVEWPRARDYPGTYGDDEGQFNRMSLYEQAIYAYNAGRTLTGESPAQDQAKAEPFFTSEALTVYKLLAIRSRYIALLSGDAVAMERKLETQYHLSPSQFRG